MIENYERSAIIGNVVTKSNIVGNSNLGQGQRLTVNPVEEVGVSIESINNPLIRTTFKRFIDGFPEVAKNMWNNRSR